MMTNLLSTQARLNQRNFFFTEQSLFKAANNYHKHDKQQQIHNNKAFAQTVFESTVSRRSGSLKLRPQSCMHLKSSQVMQQFNTEQVVNDQHSGYENIAKSVERLREVREVCQKWATVDLKLSQVARGVSRQFKTRIHSADPFNRSYCTPTTLA